MNGMAVVMIVILIGAVLLGVALAKPEIFHPVQTQISAALAQAELDAKIKEYAETLRFHQSIHEVTLVFYNTFTKEVLFIIALFATMLALGGTFCLFCLGVVMIIRAKRGLIQAQNEHLKLLTSYPSPPFTPSSPLAAPPPTMNGAVRPSPYRHP